MNIHIQSLFSHELLILLLPLTQRPEVVMRGSTQGLVVHAVGRQHQTTGPLQVKMIQQRYGFYYTEAKETSKHLVLIHLKPFPSGMVIVAVLECHRAKVYY